MCSPELKRANPKQSRTLQTRVTGPEIHYHTIALNLTTLAQFRYFLLQNHIFNLPYYNTSKVASRRNTNFRTVPRVTAFHISSHHVSTSWFWIFRLI
ncbi:hypothetical protein HanXRQr2_Chr12g0549621 [Helianthus annuus]|uniref:Uncharacterized protein n=1 Tax=Helianthus annuus TaxID=4232 RepID=A0A9K3HHT9_HELAN|nr:hypothetical protein HanXRQr2_Chr12g0549621 [Helianthus annuus]KAJ0863366.1 hypothetical protein HanPSC8_Chr12g0529151 [Helianthus annuus]